MVRFLRKKITTDANGYKHGYRSGLEDIIQHQLEDMGLKHNYEGRKLEYIIPETKHTYTPDFPVSPHIVIETKGLWTVEDRQKMLYLIAQYPDISFRMVFHRASNKIKKKSKTTYAMWCDKHGIMWADKTIPREWINDILNDLADSEKGSS